jgi:hypothetical protein
VVHEKRAGGLEKRTWQLPLQFAKSVSMDRASGTTAALQL